MIKKYRLREHAREDIKAIGKYTQEKYGLVQRNEYLLGLESHFESIAKMPQRSKPRNDIKEGYYSANYKKHVIFFIIKKDYIEIIAVLHKQMLPENHLDSR